MTSPINNKIIELLEHYEKKMKMENDYFRQRAYKNAKNNIFTYKKPINSFNELKELKIKGIGKTILNKIEKYLNIGVLSEIKNNPISELMKVHGIGYKKAEDLYKNHKIENILQLKEKLDLLNNVQKKAIRHFDDLQLRIPREEIIEFEKIIYKIFNSLENKENSKFEIVGSYRRGAKDSGDIDVIITNSKNNRIVFDEFLNALKEENIIIEFLSKGKKKSLTIGKIKDKARRLDFMYSPPHEYAFSTLYFTGSVELNVIMRQTALDIGYSMNEHCFTNVKTKQKLNKIFKTEKEIFDFLNLQYIIPTMRSKNQLNIVKIQKKKTKKNNKETTNKENKKKTKKLKNINCKINISKNKNIEIMQQIIIKFKDDGVDFLNTMKKDELIKLLTFTNECYRKNKAVISDSLYDILKEFIENKYPNVEEVNKIGFDSIVKNKVKLPYFMGSMNKMKPSTGEIDKWKKKYPSHYVISCKLDGISALYVSENNKLYTRGNGVEGQDISYMIPYLNIQDFKNEGYDNIVVRGELIMSKKNFTKYKSYKNSRNLVAGLVNSKKKDIEKWKDIDFVMYEVIHPELTPKEQFLILKKYKNCVKHQLKINIDNEYLSKYLIKWREKYEYEIDGVIITHNDIYSRKNKNPKYSIAFKMVLSDQKAEAKVLNVVWNPSKDGLLKPVVKIDKINLVGVEIENVTGYNAKFIKDNIIGIGAIVEIIRSGDVIPKITKVIKNAESPKLPSKEKFNWKWNETEVDAILINANENEVVLQKNIMRFFKILDVAAFGPGNIKRVMQSHNSVSKILNMDIDDFIKIDGFQTKSATKLYNSIQIKLGEASLSMLMIASNLFGRGFAKNRIDLILNSYPNILITKETFEKKINKITNIDGFGEKTSELFVKNIPKFMEFLNEIKQTHKLKEYLKQIKKNEEQKENFENPQHKLYKKNIVFTGFRNKEIQEKIEKFGGKITNTINKKTFILVVKDKDVLNGESKKVEKAKELKINIMVFDDLIKEYLL